VYKVAYNLRQAIGNIYEALDRGDLAVLTLLYLSAAFDTVDHSTLLQRLETSYDIDGVVLSWLSSYIQHHNIDCNMIAAESPVSLVQYCCAGFHKDQQGSLHRSTLAISV